MNTVGIDTTIVCKYCKMTVSSIKLHLQARHSDLARHKCRTCEQVFIRRRDLLNHLSKKRHFAAAKKDTDVPAIRKMVPNDVPQYFTKRARSRRAPSYDDVMMSHRAAHPPRASTPKDDWTPPSQYKSQATSLIGKYNIPKKTSKPPAKPSTTVPPIRIRFPNPEALPPKRKSKSKSKPATNMDISVILDQAEADAITL
jgi:hypothetical protein